MIKMLRKLNISKLTNRKSIKMNKIIALIFFLFSIEAHFNVSYLFQTSSLNDVQYHSYIDENQTVLYVANSNSSKGVTKKYNISTNGTLTYTGTYAYASETSPFNIRIVPIESYVVTGGYWMRLFNKSSFAFIGSTNMDNLYRWHHISSRNILVYTTQAGEVRMINATDQATLLSSNITTLCNNHSTYTFLFLNSEKTLMVTSDAGSNLIRIWNTLTWTIIKQLHTAGVGNKEVQWIDNDTLICVSSYSEGATYIYDVLNNYNLITKVITNETSIFGGYYYSSGKSLILLSLTSKSIFSINIVTYQVNHYLINFTSCNRLVPFQTNDTFGVFTGVYFIFYKIQNYQATCPTQMYVNSSTLDCANCSGNCLNCINSTICITCSNGYGVTNGTCQIIITNNTANATNVTNSSSTNSSTNSYTNINSTNIQNNKTLLFFFDLDLFQLLNKIPGSRRIFRPIFYYFMNFDDLFLYYYHEREYGPTLQSFFYSIWYTQYQKWTILNYTTAMDAVGLNSNSLSNLVDYRHNYSSNTKFQSIEGAGNTLFANTLNFFVINLPLICLEFILFRILFNLLFNYQISIIFRQFSFGSFILLMIFQGNLQLFSYLVTSELLQLFSFNFLQKIFSVMVLFCGFFVVLFAVAGFFLNYVLYGKLTKYFNDNYRGNLTGCSYLVVIRGLSRVLMGAVHALDFNYDIKLLILFLFEAVMLAVLMQSFKNRKQYQEVSKIWFDVAFGFLRIIIQLTLYFDQFQPGYFTVIQSTQYLVIWIIFSLYLLGMCIEMLKLIYKIVKSIRKFISSKLQEIQEEKLKKESQIVTIQKRLHYQVQSDIDHSIIEKLQKQVIQEKPKSSYRIVKFSNKSKRLLTKKVKEIALKNTLNQLKNNKNGLKNALPKEIAPRETLPKETVPCKRVKGHILHVVFKE